VFWTDADWVIGYNRLRVYVPQIFGRENEELKHLTQEDFWWHMLPQLLTGDRFEDDLAGALSHLFEAEPDEILRHLDVRGESFIETETHNCRTDTYYAKPRVMRMVAERIVKELNDLEPRERRKT